MKTTKDFKRFLSEMTLGIFLVTSLNPVPAIAANSSDKLIYPLKEISKLECRFNEFKNLSSNCKQKLPVLNTKNYKKYASKNGGYNDYTRLYTVLWGASYKYGWDVGNGGHIGTDIATAKGTPIYSIADGVVIKSSENSSLGIYTSIKHTINGKKVISNYLHMSKRFLNVGDRVKVGEKLGEVGSTGNSTGNHLHFQIDLETPFSPYYYDYKKCPFSYYKISEDGVCFDELAKNTIDPMLFLETRGAILNSLPSRVTPSNNSKYNFDLSIFDRTVYEGYSKSDIKLVQTIFKDLGLYKGKINGKYKNIENIIIAYQISKGVIKSKNDLGAGYFGPKTRYVTKKDYLAFLDKGTKITNLKTKNSNLTKKVKIEKISRKNLLSREEIEKREVDDFLRYHNVELNFEKVGGNIQEGKTSILKLKVTNRKGKAFKGEMPGGMTFIIDKAKVNVFPQKLFYFTDGKRDIRVTGMKEGDTKLYIKIGNQTIKTIPLKVYKAGKTIYPEGSAIISPKKITLGDKKTGIVVMKDGNGKNLINLKYGSTFKIKASDNNKICIKEGNIKNIKKIYKKDCKDSDYKNEFKFDYSNTVGGLLIYDYKATSKNFNIEVTNNYDHKILSSKQLIVSNPKGLKANYAYRNDVISLLEKGIVGGINKGYFLENRGLTQRDAITWIENGLYNMKEKALDNESIQKIEQNLENIKKIKPYTSRVKTITRQDFLDMNYTYLVLSDSSSGNTIEYRDVGTDTSQKISKIFTTNTTWKDQFGQKYFRPEAKITRGEGVFLLSQVMQRNNQLYLTLK